MIDAATEWALAYHKDGFAIDTLEPSNVVKIGLKNIPVSSAILDLGSGNGRNSIFAASLGHIVDSIDVENLNFLDTTDQKLKERINFYQKDIFEFDFKKNYYDGIIICRLIQYLTMPQFQLLIGKCTSSLKKDGPLMISYISKYHTYSKETKNVKKFEHPAETVKSLLNLNYDLIHFENKPCLATHVPSSISIESCEIVAKKKD